MNYEAIANAALAQATNLLPRWLPGGHWEGDEYLAINPTRADHKPGSFKINSTTGKAADFATDWRGGDLIAVRALVDGCSQSEAAKKLAEELGIDAGLPISAKPKLNAWQPILPVPADAPPPPEQHHRYGKPVARWCYHDADGNQLFWVYRFEFSDTEKKEICPVSYGPGGWRFKGVSAPRPLYNLHLLAQHANATLIITEGEKAADAASQLLPLPDYVVTTSPNGAQAAAKTDWQPLAGRRVIIWPDLDDPGQKYAETVAALIAKASNDAHVSIIATGVFGHDKKEGWDAADALAEGFSVTEMEGFLSDPTNIITPHKEHEKNCAAYAGEMDALNAEKLEKQEKIKRINPDDARYCIIQFTKGYRNGVYYFGEDKDGSKLPPEWICSPLEINARTKDGDGNSWGYLLEWKDPDDLSHSWAMPAEMLAGQGDEYRRALLDGGLQIAPGSRAKSHLTNYIQCARAEKRMRCTDRIGWHDGVFVLPNGSLGSADLGVMYQSGNIIKHAFKQRGTLDEWRNHIALPATGNSRAVFAISCAFAPSLLEIAGEESGGFHFRGESSSGKTTLLKLAASVWGSPEYLQRWRATTNGLEGMAQLHNDCLLILDELAQVDPREAGEIAYMLGNGSGKVRSSREGLARKAARWRLLYLSAGEIGLADHVRLSGREVKAGQEIRLADIPADAGMGLGAFEKLYECDNPALFSRSLCDAAGNYYGTAGIAFLEYSIANISTLPALINQHRQSFMKAIIPHGASGQVERVAARFALVAIAGELASYLEITGWAKGEAENAAIACFNAWLEARGGAGNLEKQKLLADIRAQLEAHSESRFTTIGKDDGRATINRMGFIREKDGEQEYIILSEMFRRELCKGHDTGKAIKTLLALGVLLPDSDGKPQRRESLPEIGRVRCYVLNGSRLWEADQDA